jgi:hypothetical protein
MNDNPKPDIERPKPLAALKVDYGHYIVLANKPNEAMRIVAATEYWAEAIGVAHAAERAIGSADGMIIVAQVMLARAHV